MTDTNATQRAATRATNSTEVLVAHGLRVTAQRITVLDAMIAERDDTTAQVLHEQLRRAHPNLGMATVYRTLNALADAGVLDRLHHEGTSTCFRYCAPGHHHHLTCRACHAVVELRDCDLASWAQHVAAAHGFSAAQHAVELSGICATCQARGAEDAPAHAHNH
ncbi:MAG: transcriptional repressor [Thermoleophilia bacterium]|nr:transcriptional repressor [Thermoleophilia bacterium]